MPIFGWSRSSSEDDLSRHQRQEQRRPFHDALPPADPLVRELELLLAQAKVGTHEFAYNVSVVQQKHEQQCNPDEPDDQTEEKLVADSGNISLLPASRDDHDYESSLTEREDVVNLQDYTALSSSSSSEGSGVLVEPPSAVDAISETSPADPAVSQDLVVVVEKEEEPRQTTTTLAVFRTPKLHFFADEKTVPAQLQHLQQHSCRKRHEFQTRIHDLDCKVAQLTAKLAEESMDLDLDLRNAMETWVYKPVEAAFETISLERYDNGSSSTSLQQQWMTLERRLSALDSQMTYSIHVQLQDLKRNLLTSLQEELDKDVLPETSEESAVANKRETAVSRRWESQVGTMARRLEEERATRVAVLGVADAKLREVDPHRGRELLAQIAALRRTLEHERAERIAQDERIRAYIAERTESMKQALLEAFPDPDM